MTTPVTWTSNQVEIDPFDVQDAALVSSTVPALEASKVDNQQEHYFSLRMQLELRPVVDPATQAKA